jgi:Flp pilus assembly protein TadD
MALVALAWGAAAASAQPLTDVPLPSSGTWSGARSTSGVGVTAPITEPPKSSVSVPYDAAIAAYRAGRPDEALATAERALQTDPRNPQLRFLRGVVLAERQRTDEAIEAFRTLTQDFPELPEPYNNLAVLYAARGDWDAARQAVEQSLRAVPGYALAHENLGDIHLQLAARAFEQAARLDPRSATARTRLSLTRELIGRIGTTAPVSTTPRTGATTETPKR